VVDKNEILTIDDIKKLVDTFYEKARNNELIGPIFNERIKDRWPEHLEKMYRFWQTVLLSEHTYFGSPFPPHIGLPVNISHFEQWMNLFIQTVDELFIGEKAEEAKWRAGKMAALFESKIDHFRRNGYKAIV
jgi:hemoglobin